MTPAPRLLDIQQTPAIHRQRGKCAKKNKYSKISRKHVQNLHLFDPLIEGPCFPIPLLSFPRSALHSLTGGSPCPMLPNHLSPPPLLLPPKCPKNQPNLRTFSDISAHPSHCAYLDHLPEDQREAATQRRAGSNTTIKNTSETCRCQETIATLRFLYYLLFRSSRCPSLVAANRGAGLLRSFAQSPCFETASNHE